MTTTAWGKAKVREQIEIPQQAGEKSFATIIQLLEDAKGETLVRFAYATGGTARRGPVTLRAQDLFKIKKALAKTPELRAALTVVLALPTR